MHFAKTVFRNLHARKFVWANGPGGERSEDFIRPHPEVEKDVKHHPIIVIQPRARQRRMHVASRAAPIVPEKPEAAPIEPAPAPAVTEKLAAKQERCLECGGALPEAAATGRPRRYCSIACRRRGETKRRKIARRAQQAITEGKAPPE